MSIKSLFEQMSWIKESGRQDKMSEQICGYKRLTPLCFFVPSIITLSNECKRATLLKERADHMNIVKEVDEKLIL